MLTMPRRPEFMLESRETMLEVLDRARYGHLAFLDESGLPDLRPLNYARVDDTLYFHTAEKSTVARFASGPVRLCAQDTVTWIPSYWRHPEMACPATTYYRSVIVTGEMRAVADPHEKARALEAFMQRYQEEGGHRRIDADDARYQGPLARLGVLALPLDRWTCRVKMGQHLTPAVRKTVHDRLVERGDLSCVREMRRANAELQVPADPEWTDAPEHVDVPALWRLLQTTYWAHLRDLATVRRYVEAATLPLCGWDDEGLAAFARVVRLSPKVAWLFDVVVREDRRGGGLGTRLMERVLAHPTVADVGRIFLDTRDRMRFYARLGFVELERKDGRSLMVRHAPS